MWYLIFLFSTIMNIWSIAYPFLVQFDVRFNILKLKGIICFKLFGKIKLELKFRIKHGCVYIYFKKKEKKVKLTQKDFNFVFFINLFQQLYFRQHLVRLHVNANFGYMLNSCHTAIICGYIDVLSKMMLSKVKNNKKSAHILIDVEPKYNEDIFNVKFLSVARISVFDLIYTLVYTLINSWGKYERKRKSAT